MSVELFMIDERTKAELEEIVGPRVRFNEPLSRHTWIGVGGPADAFVEALSEDELRGLLHVCRARHIPLLLLGGGANLIVRDGGWRGVVVRLGGNHFTRIEIRGESVLAGGGVCLAALTDEMIRRSLSGPEYLAGIPGTVGGATRMNAGAHGVTFGELVDAASMMDRRGLTRRVERSAMGFSYRGCAAAGDGVVLSVELKLREGERSEIEERFSRCRDARASALPAEPSAGCVFKNPVAGCSAGELIEQLGLKGARSGGALVSERHANVIVNRGGATARDVLALMELIREKAREDRGIDLEPELIIVGEDGKV